MRVAKEGAAWEDSPSLWLRFELLWRKCGHSPVVGNMSWLAWTEPAHSHSARREHPCGLQVSRGWWRIIQRELELQLKV